MKYLALVAVLLASTGAAAQPYNSYVVITPSVGTSSTALANQIPRSRLDIYNNTAAGGGVLWVNPIPVQGSTVCAPAVVGSGIPIPPGGASYLWTANILTCIPTGISSVGTLAISGAGG